MNVTSEDMLNVKIKFIIYDLCHSEIKHFFLNSRNHMLKRSKSRRRPSKQWSKHFVSKQKEEYNAEVCDRLSKKLSIGL